MRADPYLYFHGRCLEALGFYERAIGAKIQTVVRFSDVPGSSPGAEDKIMHAVLQIGETAVLASDGGPGTTRFEGFSLALSVASDAEAEKLFTALSEGGQVRMPLTTTPFASRMGMLTDRFGTPWMVVTQSPRPST